MAIDFNVPGRRIVGLWLLGDGATHDLMACVYRDEAKPVVLEYRFRYYKDDRIGEASRDEKNWFVVEGRNGASDESFVRLVRGMVDLLQRKGFGDQAEELMIESSDWEVIGKKLGEHAKTSQFLNIQIQPVH